MNTSDEDLVVGGEESGFDSLDSPIFIDDGPGDTTVRPARPRLRELAAAEREKLIRYGAMPPPSPATDPPPDAFGAGPVES